MICTKQKTSSPSIHARTSEKDWSTTGRSGKGFRAGLSIRRSDHSEGSQLQVNELTTAAEAPLDATPTTQKPSRPVLVMLLLAMLDVVIEIWEFKGDTAFLQRKYMREYRSVLAPVFPALGTG